MPRLSITVFLTACLLGHTFARAEETYKSRRDMSPDDSKAILQVVAKFQDAIKTKNPKELSTLVVNDNILFTQPAGAKEKKRVNDTSDVNFDGIYYGGYRSFAQLLVSSKETTEEKFYNIKITQDGAIAWVMFDYQFLFAGKVANHGLETWQMFKQDGETWKILSVIWSSHDGP
jgi:hypothetical protein